MSKTTTYECDRCGHTQESAKDMFVVKAFAVSMDRHSEYGFGQKQMDTCRSCCEGLGFLRVAQDKPQPQPPTLEELLREVLQRVQP